MLRWHLGRVGRQGDDVSRIYLSGHRHVRLTDGGNHFSRRRASSLDDIDLKPANANVVHRQPVPGELSGCPSAPRRDHLVARLERWKLFPECDSFEVGPVVGQAAGRRTAAPGSNEPHINW
jgi:hypothetical protein